MESAGANEPRQKKSRHAGARPDNLLFLHSVSETEDSEAPRSTPAELDGAAALDKRLSEQFGPAAAEVQTLGAKGKGGIRVSQNGGDFVIGEVEPSVYDSGVIARVDSDIAALRQLIYRVLIKEIGTDERVQATLEQFFLRLRLPSLDILSRPDTPVDATLIDHTVVAQFLGQNGGVDQQFVQTLSASEMSVVRGVCVAWARRNFKAYRFACMVAGALGFSEPRTLLVVNHVDLLLTRGLELVQTTIAKQAAGLPAGDPIPSMYSWLLDFFRVDRELWQPDIVLLLEAISPFFTMDEVQNINGILGSSLYMATMKAYDFLKNDIAIRTSRNPRSRSVLFSRYRQYVDVATGALKLDVFFDEVGPTAPGYVGFNPELANLVAAYIPRSYASRASNSSVLLEAASISKRQTDLLLKIGLMGL